MELVVGDHNYVISKLKNKAQRNVARRLAPLLLSSKDLLKEMFDKGKNSSVDELFASMAPLVKAIGEMSDADSDYIFDNCLACVKRQVTGGWQSITIGGELRYEDITLPDQIKLTIAVIKESLGDFTSALPGTSSGDLSKE